MLWGGPAVADPAGTQAAGRAGPARPAGPLGSTVRRAGGCHV